MHRNITAKLIKQATLKISKMGWGGNYYTERNKESAQKCHEKQ